MARKPVAFDPVAIEIRAAEIAAQTLSGDGHQMTWVELGGWLRAGDNRRHTPYANLAKEAQWQAGHLAAIIWFGEVERG